MFVGAIYPTKRTALYIAVKSITGKRGSDVGILYLIGIDLLGIRHKQAVHKKDINILIYIKIALFRIRLIKYSIEPYENIKYFEPIQRKHKRSIIV